MAKPKPKYFTYRCKFCNSYLVPIYHDRYSIEIKISVSWQNYYCTKCKKNVYTDYGWNKDN